MSETVESANTWIETEDGQRLPLERSCRLGRKPGSDITISGPKASREHAFIQVQDESEFWLIDLGSLNGTFLNNQRLLRPTRLHNGDRFVIAGLAFLFRQSGGVVTPGGMTTVRGASATVLDLVERKAWLVIVDIENFVELSRTLPRDELAVSVGTWIQKGRRLVEKAGGRISKFLGDGFLACWDTAGDKTPAVMDVLSGFHELRESGSVKFRTIVHHGIVTFGGAMQLGEENMFGPELNYIFRLEKLAAQLCVTQCASHTAEPHLAPHLRLEAVPGEHPLKGIPGLHRCFRILWP
jgi:adenylate cyclase